MNKEIQFFQLVIVFQANGFMQKNIRVDKKGE